ncbi:MAG: 6-pyruvoyl-tetrahydropterin synthase-related protein [Firmicutes bacterium]|nr:6-pyruvoyl-tetrahydropterin synthase-related protein [Bacillota bacterium]
MAEAEAAVTSRKAQIGVIEQEIIDLENELNLYNQLLEKHSTAKESVRQDDVTENSSVSGHEKNAKIKSREPVQTQHKESESGLVVDGLNYNGSSLYTIKLVSFINARHFVSFGQNPGPVHAHSWQIQIEIRVPAKNPDLVAFAKILGASKSVLAPYENVVLNHVHPFNKVQPTTENIALYLYNRLEDAMLEIGLGLGKLSVWETPTRGIEVDRRYPEIDTLIEDSEAGEISAPGEEAAATLDDEMADDEFSGRPYYKDIPEQSASEKIEPSVLHSCKSRQYAVSFVIICLAAFLAYHSVLLPPAEKHYPWGSDTWGHLFKAEYLYHEISKGNYYPLFTEYWYNGHQPFRYWAPLPYYVLFLLRALCGDIFTAGNYYVIFCALLGGLSWLLLARRMGLWPATMAGVLWVLWLDNVRVAFSEGNLPRVLATALLPLIFAVFLDVLEKRKYLFGIISAVILIHLVVICHAMIAAVYCLCLAQFSFLLWVFRGCGLKDCVRGVLVLAGGVVTAGWWLLPSMTGGITELDVESVKNALQFVSASISFNPVYRFTSRETFYWGISIILALTATCITFRSKPPWAKSLALCGIGLVIITFPVMRPLYITLPLSHLLWPLRFSSFAALAILGSCLSFNLPERRQRLIKSSYVVGMLVAFLFVALLLDSIVSVRLLAHTGSKSFNLIQSVEVLKKAPGWRVATIDLSRLGSAPSFVFSEMAGLEQVFGWAWQGAVTSNSIMLLNTGLEMQYYPFLFRSCNYLGATELLVKDDVIEDPEAFKGAAAQAGYKRESVFSGLSIWHGVDYPYIIEKQYKCLVVGKYAGIVALQFPGVEMATSRYIDDYPLEYYKKYPVVIFTGAEYRSKAKAEEIVANYAASGGRAYIEMAGMPQSVLAKQPEFLGVHGEPVTLEGQLAVFGKGRNILLQPFSSAIPLWKAYVPLVLDGVELEFKYYGNQAPIFGYKLVNGNKVWFFGGNIIYHSFLSGDPQALNLLRDILGLRTDYTAGKVIPLTHYHANERGYEMGYRSDRDFEAVVPVAAMDGIKVEVDGKSVPPAKFENLLQVNLPAGNHEITICIEKTPIYLWGAVLSSVSVVLIATALFIYRRTDDFKS